MRSPCHPRQALSVSGNVLMVATLGLLACGRIGFEDITGGDDDDGAPAPARDGGLDGATMNDSSVSENDAGPMQDASTLPDAGPNEMDATVPPDAQSGMDTGVGDAMAPIDGALDDAEVDGGDEPDTGVDATVPCAEPVLDYCSELPSLPTAPVLDGVLECGLQLQTITPREWTSVSPIPTGHVSRVAAAYRPDGVYVFVEVDDATRLPAISTNSTWCGDGVELYVDSDGSYTAAPSYDNPGSIQLLAVAPADAVSSVSRGERYRGAVMVPGVWAPAGFAAFPTASGYVLEAFVTAADIELPSLSLAAGGRVGLDVGVNVSVSTDPPPAEEVPDCGRRLGQYFMSVVEPGCADSSCLPFLNASAFCNPTLL